MSYSLFLISPFFDQKDDFCRALALKDGKEVGINRISRCFCETVSQKQSESLNSIQKKKEKVYIHKIDCQFFRHFYATTFLLFSKVNVANLVQQ